MPEIVVHLSEISQKIGGLPIGVAARDYFSNLLDDAFDQAKASEFDPLKVIIDFADIDGVGVLVVRRLIQKIDEVYEQDLSWYVTFGNLETTSDIYGFFCHIRPSIPSGVNSRLPTGALGKNCHNVSAMRLSPKSSVSE